MIMELINIIPDDITILSGGNGSGKTNLLNKFVSEYNYVFYTESHYNGLDRKADILEFCSHNNNVVIDNIDIYLDSTSQRNILHDIITINPTIKLLCTTHSPLIIMNGWLDNVINIEDIQLPNERENAMKWWNELCSGQKTQICDTHTELIGSVRRWETLTGSEIEIIYRYTTNQTIIANYSYEEKETKARGWFGILTNVQQRKYGEKWFKKHTIELNTSEIITIWENEATYCWL